MPDVAISAGQGIFTKTTKTKSSVRTLKLLQSTLDLLKEFKVWQTAERLKVGDKWEDNDRLFTQWNGKPMHPDSLTGWLKKFIQRTDLPQVHIHSLRHTNATLLIAGGPDVRTVSAAGACANHNDDEYLQPYHTVG